MVSERVGGGALSHDNGSGRLEPAHRIGLRPLEQGRRKITPATGGKTIAVKNILHPHRHAEQRWTLRRVGKTRQQPIDLIEYLLPAVGSRKSISIPMPIESYPQKRYPNFS